MRNAMEALGGSEAIRERWRLGGGDDLPADATPLAADHFRGAVHELFLRGEESLLVTLVAAFAEGLGDAPVRMSEERMLGVVDAVTSTCGGKCEAHVRDGVKRLLFDRMYSSVWSAVPLDNLTNLLFPRQDLGDLTQVHWEAESRLAEIAIGNSDWMSRTVLNIRGCVGTYHTENRYTITAPVVLDAVGAPFLENGMHRLHAAALGRAPEAVVLVRKRYADQTPGRALSPEVLSFR